MSTFKEIQGRNIRSYTTNPTDPLEGQMWYNQTELRLKGVVASGAWSSASPTIVARDKAGAAGTQTALLAIGGDTALTSVDEYNGTGWKSAPAINTGRHGMASGGTTSAAWKAGGSPPATTTATEEYNGSSWTTVPGTLNTGRYILGSCGTQTAGLACGGYDGSTNVNNSEEYNGTSWSEGNNINTTRRTLTNFGIQTAAVTYGGLTTTYVASAEEYDGTSWTSVTNYPTNVSDSAASGTLTAGLAFGGNVPPSTTATKNYDGTSWTAAPSLGTAAKRSGGTPAGSNTAALNFGGDAPGSHVTTTEEYNFTANTVTAGAWASAPAMGTGRYLGGYGTNTPTSAAITFGGQSTTSTALTETFDGSSWSEQPDMNTARSRIKGFGTQTAAAVMGGRQVGTPVNNMDDTEEYNGSSWTSVTNYPSDNRGIGGAGTQTAGLAIGGTDPAIANVFDYDGTNWTAAEGNLNTARGYISGWGTQTAAGAAGGSVSPNKQYEEYNGSSWTSKSSLIVSGDNISGSGSNPSAIFASGNAQPVGQAWNGTAWATSPNRGTGSVGGIFAAGIDSTSALVSGGYVYPSTGPSTASEQFTGETTAVNIETVTTS